MIPSGPVNCWYKAWVWGWRGRREKERGTLPGSGRPSVCVCVCVCVRGEGRGGRECMSDKWNMEARNKSDDCVLN